MRLCEDLWKNMERYGMKSVLFLSDKTFHTRALRCMSPTVADGWYAAEESHQIGHGDARLCVVVAVLLVSILRNVS